MHLKRIEENDITATIAVLTRGFSERSRAFWEKAFRRWSSIEADGHSWPIGYLLQEKEADVGVMLTFRSTRIGEAGRPITILNLSSFFIDPQFRWSASLIMKRIIRDKGTVTTDLTPSPGLWPMLESFSFEPWNEGLCISAVPQSIRFWRLGGRACTVESLSAEGLPVGDKRLFEDHVKLGCIACVLIDGDQHYPLLFKRRYIKNIPYAHLIYARKRSVVLRHLASIGLYLLRHGFLFVGVDCFENDRPKSAIFLGERKFFKGAWDPESIDYAYSELVYLGL